MLLRIKLENFGKSQGYVAGYSIGYSNGLMGVTEYVEMKNPYESQSLLWKGFSMSYSSGYWEGFEDGRKNSLLIH